MMHSTALRHIDNTQAGIAKSRTKLDLFEIGREIAFVEVAVTQPYLTMHEEYGTAYILDVGAATIRSLAFDTPPDMECQSVRLHYAAGVFKGDTVGGKQASADCAHRRVSERLIQRLEPSGSDYTVLVDDADHGVRIARRRGAEMIEGRVGSSCKASVATKP